MNYYFFKADSILIHADTEDQAKEKLYNKLCETSKQFSFTLYNVNGKKV